MILASGSYLYRGVPQDGTSYDQLRDYYNKRKAAKNIAPVMQYEQPTQKADNTVAPTDPEPTTEVNDNTHATASETPADISGASSTDKVDN